MTIPKQYLVNMVLSDESLICNYCKFEIDTESTHVKIPIVGTKQFTVYHNGRPVLTTEDSAGAYIENLSESNIFDLNLFCLGIRYYL